MPVTKTTPEEILRATWAVFHQYGFHDASLQQLADAAGLGKAGLLHHFGSKAGLMRAVIEYGVAWYKRKILHIVNGEGAAAARLETLLRKQYELCMLNEGGGCFFGNTILETGVNGAFSAGLQGFHDAWSEAVTTLLSEMYPPEEARERTYRLFADYQGSVLLFKLYQDVSHLDRFLERALASLHQPLAQ
ncbi:MAG: TetR/AcrR family transcriptional regulator [Bacteroidota bacterium]